MNEAHEAPHGRCTGQEKPLATPHRSLGGRAGLDPTWGRGEGDTRVHQTSAGKKAASTSADHLLLRATFLFPPPRDPAEPSLPG